MERIPLEGDISESVKKILNQIFDAALGDIIQLTSDPTTAGGQLNPNQIGFNPTTIKLFINLFGSTYSVTLTLT